MARVSRKNPGNKSHKPFEQTIYRVGIYARLSVEDLRKKESDSIGTQMTLLRQYVSERPDMLIIEEYEDTDQTGTNFNRPGFNRMLDDVRATKINCIIVKDLSRFGRNYIEAGNYLERVFPFMGVRFISINDNYDSIIASGDEALVIPLKNLMNEVYAKDISKKVRSQYEMKRKKGEFCGCFAPYGYIKESSCLVVDDVAAEVVQRIFALVIDGHSDKAIADTLNDDGILPPNRHRYESGILKGDKHKSARYWYKSVVKRITENTTYLGRLEQGKYKTDLMNGGNRVNISPDNWVVVENTHPPIIDMDTFETVSQIRQNRKIQYIKNITATKRPPSDENILKGLVFCVDCKRAMIRHKVVRANQRVDYSFLCPTYEENCKYDCTKKYFMESKMLKLLHATISAQIQTLVDVKKIIKTIQKRANNSRAGESLDKCISTIRSKLSKTKMLRSSLYEDFKTGILSESDYIFAKSKYEAQYNDLTVEIEALTTKKAVYGDILGQNKWAAAYLAFDKRKKLNRELLISLIDRIEISNYNHVSITLHYRDEYEALMQVIMEHIKGVAA
jgi:DNA invertase Pin-like site-specific DNA recombinase